MALPLQDRGAPAPTARIPPHNLDAEESLLGAMLLSRDAIAAATEVRLGAGDFYKPAHGHVFDAICGLYTEQQPVDAVTVADTLDRAGLLEAIGGTAALVAVQAATPATTNAERYARLVQEYSLLRRLIAVGGELTDLGYQAPDDITAALDLAEAKVFELTEGRVTDSTRNLYSLLEQQLDRLELLAERTDDVTGLATGYLDLDELTAGLQPSTLVVIGARPGMGKTALALGMAGHAAVHEQVPTLFFSLEMGHLELTQRLLAAEAKVDSTKLRNGKLSTAEWGRIHNAVGHMASAPLFIDDNPHLTAMEIRAKARRMKAADGLGLVVIDYLQLMSGRPGADNRQVEVAEISRSLKILARELEIPVLALSQLSRNLEARTDKRPQLADLRESGSIEQDADIVMFLFRKSLYEPDDLDAQGVAELSVAKHRNGPVGRLNLAFLDPYTKFENMARHAPM